MTQKLTRRKTDGQLFRPSFAEGYTLGCALVGMLSSVRLRFYFRSIEWLPRRWWFGGQWVDTGEIWEPESGEFDVIDEQDAIVSSALR